MIDCTVETPASQIATVLCCAKREAVANVVITNKTSLVVLWGFALPISIARAYTIGDIRASILLIVMKVLCISHYNKLLALANSSR